MNILYAGDSPAGGPANYLLGVLKYAGARTTHVPPSEKLNPKIFSKKFNAVLLSDYSASQCSSEVQGRLIREVESGMGFMMIGGWGSFSGPFGGWRGSLVEKILPIRCLGKDDRVNFPGGAAFVLKQKHKILGDFSSRNLPVICGLNRLLPRTGAKTVLAVRRILHQKKISLERKEYPLLVVSSNPLIRTAALATDAAPHWCGGMVDWGTKTLKLPVTSKIRIEVGDSYVRFLSALVRWLSRVPA